MGIRENVALGVLLGGVGLGGCMIDLERTYLDVAAGNTHACAIDLDREMVCWGSSSAIENAPTEGSFVQVAAGLGHTCAVAEDGSVQCWGRGEVDEGASCAEYGSDHECGQSIPPEGSFLMVAAGHDHTCGVTDSESVICWGDDSDGQSSPPSGSFLEVSAGSSGTCGLTKGREVRCWGWLSGGLDSPPTGTFASVAVTYGSACAVTSSGSMECWGASVPTFSGADYVQVAAYGGFFIGRHEDGTLTAGESDYMDLLAPPEHRYVDFDVGYMFGCGLTTTGSLVCWDLYEGGYSTVTTPP